jgi:hypothetical protein
LHKKWDFQNTDRPTPTNVTYIKYEHKHWPTELYSTPPPVSRPLDFTNGTNRRPTTTMVKKIKRLHNILN